MVYVRIFRLQQAQKDKDDLNTTQKEVQHVFFAEKQRSREDAKTQLHMEEHAGTKRLVKNFVKHFKYNLKVVKHLMSIQNVSPRPEKKRKSVCDICIISFKTT